MKTMTIRKKRTVNDFSKYCGGWTQKEYDKFEAAVANCEKIDAEAWKDCRSYDSHFDHVGGLIRLAP